MNRKFPVLESLFKQFKPMLFRRKEEVARSDYLTNSVFYLNKGFIRLYTVSAGGNELTLHIFGPSDIFPVWLNSDLPFSGYYFESLTPAAVYYCERSKLAQFIEKNPKANPEIIAQLIFFSQSVIKKLESKIFFDAYQQVIATILDLTESFGEQVSTGITISYWFTHQDIANIASLSRERVTTEINNLVKEGLISYNSHFIMIPKIESLKAELNKP